MAKAMFGFIRYSVRTTQSNNVTTPQLTRYLLPDSFPFSLVSKTSIIIYYRFFIKILAMA